MARKLLGRNREEEKFGRINLHNGGYHNLYFSPNINTKVKEGQNGRGLCGKYGREKKYLQGFGEETCEI